MVLFHLKTDHNDGFLYETTTSTENNDLISSLVAIHNKRIRAKRITDCTRGLALYGVMKKPEQVGDVGGAEEEEEVEDYGYYQQQQQQQGQQQAHKADPSGVRIGYGPNNSNMVETLQRVANELDEYVDKSQVQRRVTICEEEMDVRIGNVRGAVAMAYPMGLPEWDVLRLVLEDVGVDRGNVKEKGECCYSEEGMLDVDEASLWVVGKEFVRGRLVSDRLGTNEKTKVVAKLVGKGSGAPAREAAVSEEERKAMMAYYFKRQEEMKRLAEADDDDYLNSTWADPKNLKRNLNGIENVRAPGVSRF